MSFGSFGLAEMLVVALVILLVFGAGKLPTVMKDLGDGVKAFKAAASPADDAAKQGRVEEESSTPRHQPSTPAGVAQPTDATKASAPKRA